MASKQGTVCYFCLSVLLVSSLLPTLCSSDLRDDWLEYSLVDGTSADPHRVVHVEAIHPIRAKRQAPVESPTNSSSGNDGGSPTTQVPFTTPSAVHTHGSTTPAPAQTTVPPQATEATTVAAPQGNQNATAPPVIIKDSHSYYKSMIIPGAVNQHFVILTNPQTHDSLNSAHRLAGVVKLPFPFRFYGHKVTNVTIATGGFLYMSPFLHRFLASTQYIAPLMANFHTAASNDSNIFFQHIGDEFVIEWQKILLKNEEEKGSFTFQAKLKVDGTITFVYKNLPVPITNISTDAHPVKIGLSDAYYNDTHIPEQGIIRRRIIEYHRVVISTLQVEQGTVVILTPLPTCNVIEDCKKCAIHEGVNFNCRWCSNVGRCSSGTDWYRQDWERKGCKVTAHADVSQCNLNITTPTTPTHTTTHSRPVTHTTTHSRPVTHTTTHSRPVTTPMCRDGSCKKKGKKDTAVAAAVTVCVLLVILLVAVGVWVYYAYTHPTSPSGIWLMEHRPSVLGAKLANFSCCKKKPPPSTKYAMESNA